MVFFWVWCAAPAVAVILLVALRRQPRLLFPTPPLPRPLPLPKTKAEKGQPRDPKRTEVKKVASHSRNHFRPSFLSSCLPFFDLPSFPSLLPLSFLYFGFFFTQWQDRLKVFASTTPTTTTTTTTQVSRMRESCLCVGIHILSAVQSSFGEACTVSASAHCQPLRRLKNHREVDTHPRRRRTLATLATTTTATTTTTTTTTKTMNSTRVVTVPPTSDIDRGETFLEHNTLIKPIVCPMYSVVFTMQS